MQFTYTYDPAKLSENGKDRMRMELGDTQVEHGAETAALSDEEYNAIINYYTGQQKRGFNFSKFKCLEVIFMKMSYEVNTGIGPLNYSLSDRAKMWKELYLTMKKSYSVPSVNDRSLGADRMDEGHYFFTDVLRNPRSKYSINPFWSPPRP